MTDPKLDAAVAAARETVADHLTELGLGTSYVAQILDDLVAAVEARERARIGPVWRKAWAFMAHRDDDEMVCAEYADGPETCQCGSLAASQAMRDALRGEAP